MKHWLLALLGLCSVTAAVPAQGCYYERYWNGRGWAYRQTCQPSYQQPAYYQPVQYQQPYVPVVEKPKKELQTTVVNNLIGIPVPVQYNQPLTAQGNTVYGYSSVAEAYGNVDLGLLYNQAARLTDQAQQLAGSAAADFQSLVQSEGQNRAEVAKIIAQGQAAREALLAVKAPPVAAFQQLRSFTFRVTQNTAGQMQVERVEQNSDTPNFNLSSTKAITNISDVLQSRCVSCHNQTKTSGGLNFLQPITDLQQRHVLELITTADAARRMPKNGQLSVDEINAFFQSMGSPAAK